MEQRDSLPKAAGIVRAIMLLTTRFGLIDLPHCSSPLFEINSPVQRKLKAISKCTRHGPAWKPLCDLVSSMQDGQLVNTIRASPADDTDPQHRTSDTTSPVKMTTYVILPAQDVLNLLTAPL